jgi:exodeoxyribonuclease-5
VSDFTQQLLSGLGHVPTAGQQKAMDALERLLATDKSQATLVLKGYAGTGKTTLVGALVKVLRQAEHPFVLLAPTGRAAKVLEAYSLEGASTIHRRIYRVGSDEGQPALTLAPNKDPGALFVVDEASMIGMDRGSDGPFGGRELLNDLFEHVFSGTGCKLLLIGDPAQLPPVGSDRSPALDTALLRERFGLTAGSVELTEVVRQQQDSGILSNATALRGTLADKEPKPLFIAGFPDVMRTDGPGLQDELEGAFAQVGQDEVCVITRSNKRAYQYSQQVRARIHGFEEELNGGDRLMVVRNDYFWAGQDGKEDLIANGEQLEVQRVKRLEEKFGFRFAWIDAAWWSGHQRREGEVLVMLDVLALDAPALPHARKRMLNEAVLGSIPGTNKRVRLRKLKQDPYANALQVKYAYAVTCHKAQGGQWKIVFVDQGYVTEDMIDREYVRWLYTAVTRASEKLHLVNFHGRFWGE